MQEVAAPRPIRLLQAMAGARVGGAEAFFMRFTEALARAGQEQRVLIRRHDSRALRLRDAGIDTKELRFGGVFDCFTGVAFSRAVREWQPDIVLTWMSRATAFCPVPRVRQPFIHAARLGGYYALKNYRHCDHLIANTPDILEWVRGQGWPFERSHYLPNFVTRSEAAIPADRGALQTPVGAPVILALGRLHPNKGFDILLRALAELSDVYLWLAGEGPLEAELRQLTAALEVGPRVRFLGWREDTPALMASSQLLVCPSRDEPLGNVVIEAWAQEVPVVATRAVGPTMLIRPGESGILVPVDDAAALAAAVGQVLGQPLLAQHLVAGGRAAYEAQFTETAVVRRWQEFFGKIAVRSTISGLPR